MYFVQGHDQRETFWLTGDQNKFKVFFVKKLHKKRKRGWIVCPGWNLRHGRGERF